jgi:multidrug resistance efflux pump
MKNQKPEILYSDSVKEIMGKPPKRILRWGTSLMVLIFILFFFFAWIIKYSDIVQAPVEITTTNPPVTLVTKITGRIKSFNVKERQKVSAGQLIATMETTASMNDVVLLKRTIDSIQRPEELSYLSLPQFSGLGELQSQYGAFLKNLSDLNNYLKNDPIGSKISSLTHEIEGIKEYIERLTVKEKLYSENRKLGLRQYKRDSLLYAGNVTAESDYEKSHQALIMLNIELQQARLDHSAKTIELSQKKQTLEDYRISRTEDRERMITGLRESFLNLKAQVDLWENTYLLISPIDGIVSFTKYWSENQSVVKDEPVLSIVPLQPGSFLGRINLKMLRSGKVKEGMQVNIKLSGYPYLEYGIVRGIVKSKSQVPSGDSYIIDIELPEGLKTMYGKNLDFTQNMQGTAEIVTDKTRLLQKIVNPFRYMISKNKK